MTNTKNLVPIQEVQYLENKIPTIEEIKNGVQLPKGYVEKLLNPQAKFNGDLVAFPVQTDQHGNWEWLRIPCVSKFCPTKDSTPSQWYHDNDDCLSCDQKMLWSTHAQIKCYYCDRPSHISNWQFKCHRCPKYGSYDKTKFLTAIRIADKVKNVDADFSDKLFEYMAEHEYEFN
jgi:hypothetical protein